MRRILELLHVDLERRDQKAVYFIAAYYSRPYYSLRVQKVVYFIGSSVLCTLHRKVVVYFASDVHCPSS